MLRCALLQASDDIVGQVPYDQLRHDIVDITVTREVKRAVPTQAALRDELLAQLQAELDRMERAQKVTREGATHEEAKPEDSKDTRALEQSYLARGQAIRVEDQRHAVAEVAAMGLRDFGAADPVALGAVVTVGEEGQESALFMAPQGGGAVLAGGLIRVVTPSSPIGRALIGRRLGEEVELQAGKGARLLEIVAVR